MSQPYAVTVPRVKLSRDPEAMAIAQVGAPLLIVIVALPLAFELSPSRAAEPFYSAAAQVIPILLLVLALEVRMFRLSAPPALTGSDDLALARRFTRLAVLIVTLSLFVIGELQALDALAREHAENANASTVYTAIVIGLLLIAFLAMFGQAPSGGDERKEV